MQELFDERGYMWHGLCEQLCAEAKLFFPFKHADARLLACGNGNWRGLFLELWPLRHRFCKPPADRHSDVQAASQSFRLAAHCRVRPANSHDETEDGNTQQTAVSTNLMPLHQRIALMKQSHPELSQKQVMQRILAKDKCEPASSAREDSGCGFTASVLSVTPGEAGSVLTVSPGVGIRSWEFDNVFPEISNQHDIYRQCGLRLAVDLVNGACGALIVYGQTGSGKTHTMFGPSSVMEVGQDMPSLGLVSRIADEVLVGMESRRRAGFDVSLGASYIEIFGNDMKNLIGDDIVGTLAASQRIGHRCILNGQCDCAVSSRKDLIDLLAKGALNKRQASTAMNEHSSRAHTLVILRLRQRAPGKEHFMESTLSLADLGGSERVKKSKANETIRNPGSLKAGDEEFAKVTWAEYYQGRERITETNYINKGLLALKRCIYALIQRQTAAKEGMPLPRIPFMDSKLTMLLEPALSGDARTSLIVCCSPEDRHAEETVQSLRFGEMCSFVQHERSDGVAPDVNVAVAHALEAIDAELRDVEQAIRQKERWEWRARTKKDVVNEMDAGGTVMNKDEVMELGGAGAVEFHADDGTSMKREIEHQVWGQVLVGAEAENVRREELLKRRQRLLGQESSSLSAGQDA
jgi:kinesin family protein 5